MNASVLPERLLAPQLSGQRSLELATEGVLRYVWHGRFGPMLIEVVDGNAYVNGQRVHPAPREASSPSKGT